MTDEFAWWNPNGPASTPEERRKRKAKAANKPNGYAALPGTGPAGEKCKTCRHKVRIGRVGSYIKCALMERYWKGSSQTDILSGSPACSRWEAPDA